MKVKLSLGGNARAREIFKALAEKKGATYLASEERSVIVKDDEWYALNKDELDIRTENTEILDELVWNGAVEKEQNVIVTKADCEAFRKRLKEFMGTILYIPYGSEWGNEYAEVCYVEGNARVRSEMKEIEGKTYFVNGKPVGEMNESKCETLVKVVEGIIKDKSNESDTLLKMSDDEHRQLIERNRELEDANAELRMENEGLSHKCREMEMSELKRKQKEGGEDDTKNILIKKGQSADEIYEDEMRNVIIEVLLEKYNQIKDNGRSRKSDILKHLLDLNAVEKSERRTEMEEALRDCLKEGTVKDEGRLRKLGFTVDTTNGAHKELSYETSLGTYKEVLASTSSDIRAGKNASAIIIKTLFK